MMNLLSSLMSTGSQAPAITDMSQIKVQPQAVDLSGTFQQAGNKAAEGFKVDLKKDQQTNDQLQGLLGAMTTGGVNALGGKKQSQQVSQAPAYQGGGFFQNPGAQSLSDMRMSGAPNLRGILNG